MAKDRSTPFSRKHRRYWLPVTGGMVLIGAINVSLGYCTWPDTPLDRTPERIIPQIPVSQFERPADGGVAHDAPPPQDAGVSDDPASGAGDPAALPADVRAR
ncbi:MAG: hypothetical protein R3B48_08310 [Kofleriaceae bacterium]